MKDMDDDSDASGSDKDSEEEEEEEESGSDGGGSGGVAVFDPKASHSSWQFDKKTKIMKCNNSSWYTAISKKTYR